MLDIKLYGPSGLEYLIAEEAKKGTSDTLPLSDTYERNDLNTDGINVLGLYHQANLSQPLNATSPYSGSVGDNCHHRQPAVHSGRLSSLSSSSFSLILSSSDSSDISSCSS